MRTKDEFKQEAVIRATVRLVNEIGFVSSSVSKIAKEAGVSPATIYVYYKNKDDLLVSTYVDIKQKLSRVMLKDFNEEQPIRDTMKAFWLNAFKYIRLNPEYFKFMEQFSNSPYSSFVNKFKHIPCCSRAPLSAHATMQAYILVLDHDPARLQFFRNIQIL